MITLSNKTTEVWKLFYDLCKEITSVSITGGQTITIQNYVSAYSEKMLETKSNYPVIIVNSPEFDARPVTYSTREYSGRIEVEIMTNQSESADKFKDLIMAKIEDSESDLLSEGLSETELDDTSSTHYERGHIKVHSRKLVWRFML